MSYVVLDLCGRRKQLSCSCPHRFLELEPDYLHPRHLIHSLNHPRTRLLGIHRRGVHGLLGIHRRRVHVRSLHSSAWVCIQIRRDVRVRISNADALLRIHVLSYSFRYNNQTNFVDGGGFKEIRAKCPQKRLLLRRPREKRVLVLCLLSEEWSTGGGEETELSARVHVHVGSWGNRRFKDWLDGIGRRLAKNVSKLSKDKLFSSYVAHNCTDLHIKTIWEMISSSCNARQSKSIVNVEELLRDYIATTTEQI